MQRSASGPAFTLIELLVVVAIIAILAAIALPNLLAAQVRAKVSRARSDFRTVATAIESYRVDHNGHPYPLHPYKERLFVVRELTTPVAYLTTVALRDPFAEKHPDQNSPPPPGFILSYYYDNYSGSFAEGIEYTPFPGFILASVGPDREFDAVCLFPVHMDTPKERHTIASLYDPTNGTTSSGDIAYWTGKPMKYWK